MAPDEQIIRMDVALVSSALTLVPQVWAIAVPWANGWRVWRRGQEPL